VAQKGRQAAERSSKDQRGVGRPVLPVEVARSILVQARLNEMEDRLLRQACAADGGRDVSSAIRLAIGQWSARVLTRAKRAQ
jgi:hypothetical protein